MAFWGTHGRGPLHLGTWGSLREFLKSPFSWVPLTWYPTPCPEGASPASIRDWLEAGGGTRGACWNLKGSHVYIVNYIYMYIESCICLYTNIYIYIDIYIRICIPHLFMYICCIAVLEDKVENASAAHAPPGAETRALTGFQEQPSACFRALGFFMQPTKRAQAL